MQTLPLYEASAQASTLGSSINVAQKISHPLSFRSIYVLLVSRTSALLDDVSELLKLAL